MRGTINSIWLTSNRKFHFTVIDSLKNIVDDATKNDFKVILYTNKKDVDESEIEKLTKHGVLVNDYKECSSSIFNNYFTTFLNKALKGDNTAFALASDILRMSLLELSPPNQYCIYFDANDIIFADLNQSLSQLDHFMKFNSLGLSFYIGNIEWDKKSIRNDVIMAKKEINPKFFEDYFQEYEKHLKENASKYFTPKTNDEAMNLARKISNQTNYRFFYYEKYETSKLFLTAKFIVKANFGDHCEEFASRISCLHILPYIRDMSSANSWLPNQSSLEEGKNIPNHVKGQWQKETIEKEQELVIKNRHNDFELQEEYDQFYGIIPWSSNKKDLTKAEKEYEKKKVSSLYNKIETHEDLQKAIEKFSKYRTLLIDKVLHDQQKFKSLIQDEEHLRWILDSFPEKVQDILNVYDKIYGVTSEKEYEVSWLYDKIETHEDLQKAIEKFSKYRTLLIDRVLHDQQKFESLIQDEEHLRWILDSFPEKVQDILNVYDKIYGEQNDEQNTSQFLP